jgi:competence ComEA-like helix-hairpin-helix protein
MSQTLSKLHLCQQLTRVQISAGRWLCVAFCYALVGASVSCVKLPRQARATTETATATVAQRAPNAAPRININMATSAEFESLPGIGPGLAARIIEHRARYGPFRRVEHLLIVRGISERRFAQMRPFISTQ